METSIDTSLKKNCNLNIIYSDFGDRSKLDTARKEAVTKSQPMLILFNQNIYNSNYPAPYTCTVVFPDGFISNFPDAKDAVSAINNWSPVGNNLEL